MAHVLNIHRRGLLRFLSSYNDLALWLNDDKDDYIYPTMFVEETEDSWKLYSIRRDDTYCLIERYKDITVMIAYIRGMIFALENEYYG